MQVVLYFYSMSINSYIFSKRWVNQVPGKNTFVFSRALSFPCLLHCPVILPTPAWELFHVENQCDNTRSLKPLSSFNMWLTPSINLGIMTVMSTWIFVVLIGYCHIGSQRGGVPTQVQAGRLGNEGGVGGTGPNQTQMRFSVGCKSNPYLYNRVFLIWASNYFILHSKTVNLMAPNI